MLPEWILPVARHLIAGKDFTGSPHEPHHSIQTVKTLIRIAATGMAVLACSWAEETPASPATAAPVAAQASSWSLVYLPDLIWSEEEATQTVALLQQLKPDLVVSMAPCPFANTIRALECKPAVLDQTQRAKLGEDCSLPAISWSGIEDKFPDPACGGHAAGGRKTQSMGPAPQHDSFTPQSLCPRAV